MVKTQFLTDEFNKMYWAACQKRDAGLFYQAALLGRQLVLELGREGLVEDKMMDPSYTNKATLEK